MLDRLTGLILEAWHQDARHRDHVHIVASRIDNDGRYVPNHQEKKRSQAVCRELERDYDLRQLRSPSRRAAPTRDDVAIFERTGSVTGATSCAVGSATALTSCSRCYRVLLNAAGARPSRGQKTP
jgi:MobA/VirD2-like, nuclease domain